jgi:hypothetical protein
MASSSKKFFERAFDNKKFSSLERLKTTVLSETHIVPDSSVFKCRLKRLELYKSNPSMFLAVSDNGTPIFPIRNQFGGMSYTLLKRGISAAKSAYSKTNDIKYLDIIKKLEEDKRAIETKTIKMPLTYEPPAHLMDVLNKYKKVS